MNSDVPCPFSLPEVWSDDDVMFSLMQPIKRPQHIDPDSYNRKVSFWSSLILNYTRDTRVAIINIKALKTVFSRHFPHEGITLSPECLGESLDHLKQLGEVDVLKVDAGFLLPALRSGLSYLVKVPISALSSLFGGQEPSSTGQIEDETKVYVFTKHLDNFVRNFIEYFNLNKRNDRLVFRFPVYEMRDFDLCLKNFFSHEETRSHIKNLCFNVYQCAKPENVRVQGDNKVHQVVLVSEHYQNKINFCLGADGAVVAGIIKLKTALRLQELEEQNLVAQIDERRSRIKGLLKDKKINEAKSLLRRTKMLEKSLEQKSRLVHNLESMQFQLENTADNESVLSALADSSRVLKQVTDLNKVEETMNEVAEVQMESNEMSDLISSFAQADLSDICDLEAQLEELLKSNPLPKTPLENSEPANLATQSVLSNEDTEVLPPHERISAKRIAVFDHN